MKVLNFFISDYYCMVYARVHNVGAGGVLRTGDIKHGNISYKRQVQIQKRANVRSGEPDRVI